MARITPFGISALSKSNKEIAYTHEVMCNKDIGEMCVKTSDDDTVSYNYFTRLYTGVNTLSASAIQYSVKGDIYSIVPTGIEDLPHPLTTHTIDLGINVEDNSRGFIASIDATGIITANNTLSTITIDKIIATYTMIVTLENGATLSLNKQVNLQDMPTDIIRFPTTVINIYISDIVLSVDESITEDYILILNNILFFIVR